mmetsp:Transcript_20261/g.42371  ORF Transcript_20261/g.42371 Transcript_20261/m.42371 type:complete len:237 (+) Transcript_20261:1399-2109(+)
MATTSTISTQFTPTTGQESLAPASVPHFMTPSPQTTPINAKATKVTKSVKSFKASHDAKTAKSTKSKKTSAVLHDAKAVKSNKSTKTAKSKSVFDEKSAKTSKTMISDVHDAESDTTSPAKREKLNRNHAKEDMSMSISSSSSSGGSVTQITSTGKGHKKHQPKVYKVHDAKAEKSSKGGGGVHHSMPYGGSKGSKTTRESKATSSSSKSSKAKAVCASRPLVQQHAKTVFEPSWI